MGLKQPEVNVRGRCQLKPDELNFLFFPFPLECQTTADRVVVVMGERKSRVTYIYSESEFFRDTCISAFPSQARLLALILACIQIKGISKEFCPQVQAQGCFVICISFNKLYLSHPSYIQGDLHWEKGIQSLLDLERQRLRILKFGGLVLHSTSGTNYIMCRLRTNCTVLRIVVARVRMI